MMKIPAAREHKSYIQSSEKNSMKVLFICGQNQHRSKTAEELFRDKFETRSAGLWNAHPVKPEQLEWADVIVVMEDEHRIELAKRFPKQYMEKRIVTLGVSDVHRYNDPKLISLLEQKMRDAL